MDEQLHRLESALGYTFKNKDYLQTALTHRSLGQNNNERLEYLGDALLGFVIANILFQTHPQATEGVLTRLRATLVKGETLAKIAREIELGEYIRLGSSEMKSGGWRRKSILANTLESIFGAIYLDSGFQSCTNTIELLFAGYIQNCTPDTLVKDPKTRLQEYLQANQKQLPVYEVIEESGAAHDKTFLVRCIIHEMDITVEANGRSKRTAEQSAAKIILEDLNI